MEELLNKLIEKGWKPRGLTPMGKMTVDYDIHFAFDVYDSLQCGNFNFRELVSKESGLWQFVCENKLQPTNRSGSWEYSDGYTGWTCMAYQFRLIESALCDEDKLEDFILENITIKGTK